MQRRRIAYGDKIEVSITTKERALILDHTFVGPELENLLNTGNGRGNDLVVLMTMDDLEELMGHVAATANHAERKLQREMDRIFTRLKAIEHSYEETDP